MLSLLQIVSAAQQLIVVVIGIALTRQRQYQ